MRSINAVELFLWPSVTLPSQRDETQTRLLIQNNINRAQVEYMYHKLDNHKLMSSAGVLVDPLRGFTNSGHYLAKMEFEHWRRSAEASQSEKGEGSITLNSASNSERALKQIQTQWMADKRRQITQKADRSLIPQLQKMSLLPCSVTTSSKDQSFAFKQSTLEEWDAAALQIHSGSSTLFNGVRRGDVLQ